jgi:putative endonuclease
MYILLCANDTYYTGSTKYLEKRITQHQNGEGANYTKKHAPVKLVYTEEFDRIDYAFNREKQIQNWSKKKKAALINGDIEELKKAAKKKF